MSWWRSWRRWRVGRGEGRRRHAPHADGRFAWSIGTSLLTFRWVPLACCQWEVPSEYPLQHSPRRVAPYVRNIPAALEQRRKAGGGEVLVVGEDFRQAKAAHDGEADAVQDAGVY
jgi:hypothetical protein